VAQLRFIIPAANHGERLDVWWEILSVLAPVVFVALLGTTVLYALSRPHSHRQ
jgi:hypothetical protein